MTESTSAVDVVERLRILDAKRAPLGWEAADEIERLREVIARLHKQRREMKAALATAERERDEAREALRPFADEADTWHWSVPDSHRSLCTEPKSKQANPGSETRFTVGDLRRASGIIYGDRSRQENEHGE